MDAGLVIELLNFFREILQNRKSEIYKREIIEVIFEDFEPEVEALQGAYDKLLLSSYTLLGAYLLGSKLPPTNSEYTVDKIIDQINKSVSDVETCLLQVTKTMRNHKEEFKLLFESDPKLLVQFEDLLNIIDNNKKIDICYLGNKRSFMDNFIETNKSTEFINELNNNISNISYVDQINEIQWVKNFKDRNVLQIINDNEFFAELIELLNKYYNKTKREAKKPIIKSPATKSI